MPPQRPSAGRAAVPSDAAHADRPACVRCNRTPAPLVLSKTAVDRGERVDAEDTVRQAYEAYYRRLVAQVFGLVGDLGRGRGRGAGGVRPGTGLAEVLHQRGRLRAVAAGGGAQRRPDPLPPPVALRPAGPRG